MLQSTFQKLIFESLLCRLQGKKKHKLEKNQTKTKAQAKFICCQWDEDVGIFKVIFLSVKIFQKFLWGTKKPQNLKKSWCKVLFSIGWIFNSIFNHVQSETRCCTAPFPYPAPSPVFPSPARVPALLPSLPWLCRECPGWLGFVRSHLSLSGLGGVSFALLQPAASFHLHIAW